jgi:hypothetical protein
LLRPARAKPHPVVGIDHCTRYSRL